VFAVKPVGRSVILDTVGMLALVPLVAETGLLL
jgi:hypothetical protein